MVLVVELLPVNMAEQLRLDLLIEPSLQTKVAPLQWLIPPLAPEQG